MSAWPDDTPIDSQAGRGVNIVRRPGPDPGDEASPARPGGFPGWVKGADSRLVGRVNVNTAMVAELEALPGIGPVIARRIIEGRPYRSVEDLLRVKGIREKRLEEIRPLVKVE